jgi:hypothetical protein
MTTLNKLKKIVENNCSPQQELTISDVNKQLLLAKKAQTLGKQFLAILTIVNRYPSGSVPSDIHTELLKYDHILELIRLLNRTCLNDIPGESGVNTKADEDKLKEQYQIVVDNYVC